MMACEVAGASKAHVMDFQTQSGALGPVSHADADAKAKLAKQQQQPKPSQAKPTQTQTQTHNHFFIYKPCSPPIPAHLSLLSLLIITLQNSFFISPLLRY